MPKFILKGLKQVTSDEYASLSDVAKKGYIWFVRDFDTEGHIVVSEIYFGTRLYATTNDITEAFIKQLITITGDDVTT